MQTVKSYARQLADLTSQLKQLQGESPLAQVCVDGQAIAEVVAGWTGIPVGRMLANEIKTVLKSRIAWKNGSSVNRTRSKRLRRACEHPALA